jgi:transcriptional regulator with XRE-family HTH domain
VEQESGFKVGQRIRAVRDTKNMSLKTLSEKSGLSVMALNLIERNKTSPTLATLTSVAAACNVKVKDFFVDAECEERDYVLFKARKKQSGWAANTLAANLKGRNLNLLVTRLGQVGKDGERNLCFHPGNEFVYCLSGQVRCELGQEELVLGRGDAVIYQGRIPHRLTSGTRTSGDVLMIFEAGVEHLHI